MPTMVHQVGVRQLGCLLCCLDGISQAGCLPNWSNQLLNTLLQVHKRPKRDATTCWSVRAAGQTQSKGMFVVGLQRVRPVCCEQ